MNILIVDDSKDMRAIVIRAVKAAGYADASYREAGNGMEAMVAIRESVPDIVLTDWNMPQMSGFELIQACDIAIARDDAVLADNHLNFAMIPGGGGSQRLPRIAGSQRALGLILSGDRLTGAQAQQWGLVYRAVAPDQFEAAVAALAANLAGKDPVALARAKRLVRDGLRLPLRDGLALETEAIIEHLGGAGAAEGISRFTGRDREESP